MADSTYVSHLTKVDQHQGFIQRGGGAGISPLPEMLKLSMVIIVLSI